MKRLCRGAAVVVAALFISSPDACPAAQVPAAEAHFRQHVRPFLRRYCITCHNASLKTAGLALDAFSSAASLSPGAATWEKVIRKIRSGEMPFPGAPRPPAETAQPVTAWLTAELDRAALASPDPGRLTLHRLNRAEYDNAVRDLLAVDFQPAAGFPADDSGYGFDNIADVLSLPPVLMEKYLRAAAQVARTALGRVRYDPVLERRTAPRNIPQNRRLNEDAPLSSRGGIEVEHRFPVAADYLLRVRLRGAPDPAVPEILMFHLDGHPLARREVKFGSEEQDEEQRRVEIKIPLAAGRHRVLATFLRDDSKNETPYLEYAPAGPARRNPLAVDWLEVGGPFNVKGPGDTASRRRILACRPGPGLSESQCAAQILSSLARLAWRRPLTPAESDRLLGFFAAGRADSGEFEGGLELGLKAILVSPHFLFRIEHDPPAAKPGAVYEIAPLALASRLAFFLWSSLPDDELLTLAERGELKKPEVLAAQVARLLRDPRSSALTANFAGQWLHLRNLSSLKPDPALFPEFDDDLRDAMRRETELFFDSIVGDDRSILDFLDAPYTFLNERLASFYGISGIAGRRFRRVDLADARRGGVLTMASVLTVTSYPTRTAPVIRGKWVLENLLAAPPPPPPPNVPPLSEKDIGQTASLRQQFERHRADPACASCHAKMDPIGFALENYDAIGRWRDKDGAFPVDASGTLPSGRAFQNAAELKKILRSNPQEFALGFIEKLLTYALGRGLDPADQPVIRSVARAAAPSGYRLSAIVREIVRSAPFRLRRAAQTKPEKESPRVAD